MRCENPESCSLYVTTYFFLRVIMTAVPLLPDCTEHSDLASHSKFRKHSTTVDDILPPSNFHHQYLNKYLTECHSITSLPIYFRFTSQYHILYSKIKKDKERCLHLTLYGQCIVIYLHNKNQMHFLSKFIPINILYMFRKD